MASSSSSEPMGNCPAETRDGEDPDSRYTIVNQLILNNITILIVQHMQQHVNNDTCTNLHAYHIVVAQNKMLNSIT